MIKVIEIRTKINSILNNINPRVYFQRASDTAIFPYIVYDLPNSFNTGSLEQFVLDIDVWDNKTDTTELETLINEIDINLHKKSFAVENLVFTIYRDNRLTLTDDDKRIRRRKYVYQVRTYEGGM